MLAYQLHEALASSLADPIETDTLGGIISDGVRYSKKLRDTYLDRAIMHVLSLHIKEVRAARIDDQAELVYGIYPTFTRGNTIAIAPYVADTEHLYPLPGSFVTAEARSPIFILDCSYVYLTGTSGLTTREQLPVVPSNDYNEFVSRRFKETHYSDCVATYYGSGSGLRVYNSPNIDTSNSPDHIECNYLPYPKSLADHLWDEEVDYEDLYLATVIMKATLYGMNDSNELNEQVMAQTVLPLIANQ